MDDRELAQRFDNIEKMLIYLVKSVDETLDDSINDFEDNDENEETKEGETKNVRAKFQEE